MKPSLGLRASQHLALTPQLQQSIRLLQMSTAELEQEVENFLAQNPLLETVDTPTTAAGQESVGQSVSQDTSFNAESRPDSATSGFTEPGDEAQPGTAESWASAGPKLSGGDDDNDWAAQRAAPISLRDHLHEQAHTLALSERDMAWLETLIDSLDDDGYLRESLEELEASIAEEFAKAFDERLDPDEQHLGLSLLQSMDPAGVGARSLQECLSLQLDRLARSFTQATTENTDLPTESPIVVAKKLVAQESLLQALGGHEFHELCRVLHCDRSLLRKAVDIIQGLNPKPGGSFQDDAAETIIPDVIAFKSAGRWQVRLNESAVPRLTINPAYAEMIRQHRAGSMSAQLQEARWVIKNIQLRFDTILRVSQAIAAEQQAFFEQGEFAMKPLVLRDIAQQCELHESTVSRVTNNKYMLTPKGVFELKYFFASHVGTEGGGTASSTAIRATLKQWISEEDPQKPLSDQQISDRFAQQGVHVARRTIAKYREALRIEPVSQRKKL